MVQGLRCWVASALLIALALLFAQSPADAQPVLARRGMVVAAETEAATAGLEVLKDGGTAVDAAVATAFALAVTHPAAGNIGGGGFLVFRPASGDPVAYDFREVAPAEAHPDMFIVGGEYDPSRHHHSHAAVGVPGTVAGLHLAWSDAGTLPWPRLVRPAIKLARDGFTIPPQLAASLASVLGQMASYPAAHAQFSKNGQPYEAGDLLRQPDLASTLERIAVNGPGGFYHGRTAELIARDMQANGGLITQADLAAYRPLRRRPLVGQYRGHEVISMPPISSGGAGLIQMLNIIEGYDLSAHGFGSADAVHLMAEAMRRAYADRARHLGDPAFNPRMPIDQIISKPYARRLRDTIRPGTASRSSPTSFEWPSEGGQTTHLSVVDRDRNAASLTYTLEQLYGSKIVVPGAGFLLNNEMGDFNAAPHLTNDTGLIGTAPNLAAAGKRMLSSMTPTIVAQDGRLVLVTGSPGGRTIINTVLQTLVNVIDFGMGLQAAVDAPRFHHQWLPDRIQYEPRGLSLDTRRTLRARGHVLVERVRQGSAQSIGYDSASDMLEGAADRRAVGSVAAGY